MIILKRKQITKNIIDSATCDCCGVEVRLDIESDLNKNLLEDSSGELNNLFKVSGRYFKHTGGFGSQYDQEVIERVYCDKCLFEIIFNHKHW